MFRSKAIHKDVADLLFPATVGGDVCRTASFIIYVSTWLVHPVHNQLMRPIHLQLVSAALRYTNAPSCKLHDVVELQLGMLMFKTGNSAFAHTSRLTSNQAVYDHQNLRLAACVHARFQECRSLLQIATLDESVLAHTYGGSRGLYHAPERFYILTRLNIRCTHGLMRDLRVHVFVLAAHVERPC